MKPSTQDAQAQAEALLAHLRQPGTVVAQRIDLAADTEGRARQVVNELGLPMVHYYCALRFSRALSPVLRRYSGPELAEELRFLWTKWAAMGIEPRVMHVLTCELYNGLTGWEAPTSEDDAG